MQLFAAVEPTEVAGDVATQYVRPALLVERDGMVAVRFTMTITADLSRTS